MNEKTKLILALIQVENIIKLLEDNQFERYMSTQLNGVYYELKRQITNLTLVEKSTTIEK